MEVYFFITRASLSKKVLLTSLKVILITSKNSSVLKTKGAILHKVSFTIDDNDIDTFVSIIMLAINLKADFSVSYQNIYDLLIFVQICHNKNSAIKLEMYLLISR